MNIEVNKALIKRFPFLMPRNILTGERIDDFDYSWTALDLIPVGWRVAFGEKMCREIAKELSSIPNSMRDEFYFMDIKEKYGMLRIYPSWSTPLINQIIEKYERLSQHFCINCGDMATNLIDCYMPPLCESCERKLKFR